MTEEVYRVRVILDLESNKPFDPDIAQIVAADYNETSLYTEVVKFYALPTDDLEVVFAHIKAGEYDLALAKIDEIEKVWGELTEVNVLKFMINDILGT